VIQRGEARGIRKKRGRGEREKNDLKESEKENLNFISLLFLGLSPGDI
jgi:hypothetical protein